MGESLCEKATYVDFLPYPDVEKGAKARITKQTAQAFMRLIKQDLLPPKVIGACSGLFDEIRELAKT